MTGTPNSKHAIETEVILSSAHFLPNYDGQCGGIHGHNWRVIVKLEGELNESGMITDFGNVKEFLKELDHAWLNVVPQEVLDVMAKHGMRAKVVPIENPTAELLARYIAEGLEDGIAGASEEVDKITVTIYETDKNCVVYEHNCGLYIKDLRT